MGYTVYTSTSMPEDPVNNSDIFPNVTTREGLVQEVEKALSWKGGNVQGISLKTDSLHAIELKAGKGSIEKLKKELVELGSPFDLDNLGSYSWYPASYGPVMYLIAAHLFSWGAADIEDLGRISTRGSMLIKVIMRFISVKATLQGASGVWHKYYDFGELIPIEYSEEGSFIRFKVVGYDVHPINEFFHKGYFRGVIELVTGSTNVTAEVPKSVYRGDEHSEYKIGW